MISPAYVGSALVVAAAAMPPAAREACLSALAGLSMMYVCLQFTKISQQVKTIQDDP